MAGQAFLFALVLVGATCLSLVASYWGWTQRWRRARTIDTRQTFLARLRRAHVGIQNARDLMLADLKPRTWHQQSQRLLGVLPELAELAEDLRASPRLFRQQARLHAGIDEIIDYLNACGREYIAKHQNVLRGYEPEESFASVLEQEKMRWTADFLSGTEQYKQRYAQNIALVKQAMRAQIIFDSPDTRSPHVQ
jgi:hypothetical protein